MNAAETIQAAIEKLDELRQLATPGEWEFDSEPFGAIFTEQEPGLGVMTEVAEEMHEWDGHLIVTLHRTIDAQLKILRRDIDIRVEYIARGVLAQWVEAVERAGDLDLARAILGETP
jgi:hypothetical protein